MNVLLYAKALACVVLAMLLWLNARDDLRSFFAGAAAGALLVLAVIGVAP